MNKLDLQFLHSELERVIEWIKFSDQKSAFLSAYYLGLISFLFSQIENIKKKLIIFNDCLLLSYEIFIIFILIILIIGLIFLLLSIFPKLKNGITDKSIFYFGHVSDMKYIDYSKEILKITDLEARKQIIEQLYSNSVIANYKMKNVKYSTIMLVILFISACVLTLLNL